MLTEFSGNGKILEANRFFHEIVTAFADSETHFAVLAEAASGAC
jgi:hypothetical protein